MNNPEARHKAHTLHHTVRMFTPLLKRAILTRAKRPRTAPPPAPPTKPADANSLLAIWARLCPYSVRKYPYRKARLLRSLLKRYGVVVGPRVASLASKLAPKHATRACLHKS
jgi:hypothetical protein